MDFVYKPPRTQNGYDGIWVIVDQLTKSSHFIPVRENYSLSRLAELFISEIVKYHEVLFGDALHKHLDLMEFAYNNSYHSSIEVGKRVLVGLEIVDETTQNIQVIKANLKATQDQQKSLADKHAIDRLSPWKGIVQFGKKGKLSPTYIGPYQITEQNGEVAYRLELPLELSRVHDVFHVSMLRHYVSNPSHVIPHQPLEINPDLTYDEEPVTILDWKDKVLMNKTVRMMKVLWRNHSMENATWEIEDRMRDLYPRLFYDY
ncbi:unnamed protein product [Malus baccata var. baccata]